MNPDLQVADFPAFFAAVNSPDHFTQPRPEPFPWQQELLAQVAATGQWPALLDLPTAAGKTAVIDIAVFLMALRRDAPRRVVFVIDRRVVVQQAAERARRLAARLHSGGDPVVIEVAQRLRALAAPFGTQTNSPLQCAELRGGIVRDESWALRPDVPAILVSTVDQVGSRLLFRGYGISRGMRPVHAGLLANDALILLDEVHLSRPLAQTLGAISDRYRPTTDAGLPDRWQTVELSATPGKPSSSRPTFTLSKSDRDPAITPLLARRLSARKPASRLLVGSRARDRASQREAVAQQAANTALSIIGGRQHRVIGVVLNRVDTARRAFELLDGEEGIDCHLVTGRMRPFDRDDLLAKLIERVRTGRQRSAGDQPLVLVATQSIEAGADFDFDALVTECASFDALRQRFGRVDRDGDLSDRGVPSQSVILAASEDVKGDSEDAIYGPALAKTWHWLPETEFDFAALHPEPDILAGLAVAMPSAPILLPSHLDRWVQTSPYPDADPDVSLWLHGIGDRQADVNLIWRSDLTVSLLELEREAAPLAVALVSACPPGSGEAMPVPITAARAWLAGMAAPGTDKQEISVVDVEGASQDLSASDQHGRKAGLKPVLRWLGDDSSVAIEADDIQPGDTLIVPSSYGGVSAGNWAPGSQRAVTDLGHRVQLEQRRRATLRLHSAAIGRSADRLPPLPLPSAVDGDEELDDRTAVRDWLANARGLLDKENPTERVLQALWQERRRLVISRVPCDAVGDPPISSMFVVTSVLPMASKGSQPESTEENADSEPATSSFLGSPVLLYDHLRDVEKWAYALARACDIPENIAGDLGMAGHLHDIGKSDPRFQAMLRQGRLADGLLAKSAIPATDRLERERARRDAGYPRSARHELLSVAMVQDVRQLACTAHDWELVLYLVASHHGYCRPFAPVVHDTNPATAFVDLNGLQLSHSTATELARIDAGVPDRFWRLVRQYGWFGLAWLESLLRLADHRASTSAESATTAPSLEVAL